MNHLQALNDSNELYSGGAIVSKADRRVSSGNHSVITALDQAALGRAS